MKYLSLFSGIGGFELAIQDVFPDADCVGYSEIDKFSIQTYKRHYHGHNNFGSVLDIYPFELPEIDMIVGGFPCQDLSIAKDNREGLCGKHSGLFWQLLFIHQVVQPKYFCYENVASMPKKDKDIISRELGVEPVMINAALVSGQDRKRLFWCNWNVEQPADRGIMLKDILESGEVDERMITNGKSYALKARYAGATEKHSTMIKTELYLIGKPRGFNKGYIKPVETSKSPTLSSNSWQDNNHLVNNSIVRKLTPIECERLQCFPDNWTAGVSNSQRYKQLGNAVNVEVVKHIMENLKQGEIK